MNCHSCGFQNDDDSRICNGCGSPLRKICPRCGFENLAESKFCGGCGNRCQEAQAGDTSGERRQITALFVDLVGSTELSQRLDPEDLRDLLAVYHTVCSDAVEHHAGHIAQYLGDGVVVYFGYPRSHEDDAQRAIRCGLDILESIQILNRDSNDMDNIALHVRLGIHSGRVVIGHVGVGDVGDRIALGGTTNIAARLEGEAPVDGLAVSHTTWQMVRGFFTGVDGGLRQLKGLIEPLRIWFVDGRAGSDERVEVSSELTPLVGRESDLEHIHDIQNRSTDTHSSEFVLLRGEAGIGKSRIIRQVCSEGPALSRHLVARFTPGSKNQPFDAIRHTFKTHLCVKDSPASAAQVRNSLADIGIQDPVAIALMCDFLGFPIAAEVPGTNVTPARQRTMTIDLLVDTLSGWADVQPTLFVAEDLHWADASSLEFLARIVRAPPAIPLTVLATARPIFDVPWLSHPGISVLDLGALERSAVEIIIKTVGGGKSLPRMLTREIVEQSEGVPLFAEELTRAALASGHLTERTATWETDGDVNARLIPASIDSSLTARVDSLGDSRGTAQLAATIGRYFSLELLCTVSARPAKTVRQDVANMVKAGLANPGDDDAGVYEFKHTLIRDAAYRTLLRTTRQAYHRNIANGIAGDTSTPSADLLAYHLQESGDPAAAVVHWVAAAEAGIAINALAEAARHLSLAISCLSKHEPDAVNKAQELELQLKIWPLWAAVEGWGSDLVKDACKRGLELATELERHELLYAPLWGLWTVHFLRGEMDLAMETALQVKELAQSSGIPMIQLTGQHATAYTHLYRGELNEALAEAEAGLELFDLEQELAIATMFQLGSSIALRAVRATVWWLFGSIGAADAEWKKMEALSRELNHPPSLAAGLAFALHGIGFRHGTHGTLLQAEETIDELLKLTTEEGSALWHAVGLCYRAAASESPERPVAMQEAWERFAQTGSRLTEILMKLLFADSLLAMDDFDGASRLLDECERVMLDRKEALMAPEIWRLRARILHRQDHDDDAASTLSSARNMAREKGAAMLELRVLLDWAALSNDREHTRWVKREIHTVLEAMSPDCGQAPELEAAHRLLNTEAVGIKHSKTILRGE